MKKVKVGKSKIHGNGLIADELIKRGDVIELVHTIREIKPGVTKTTPTLLGRNYNHSDDANALNVIDGNNRYLVALKEIEVGGEITANYRANPDLEQPESFTSNDNYISFDYDDTLTTPEGFKLAKKLNEEGNNLYVITARDKITPQMIERAEAAGIPKENIITAGSDEAKVKIVKENNISKHIDNKESVIKALGDAGELFAPDKYPDLKADFVEMDLSDDDLNKLKEGGFIVEEYQDGGTTECPPGYAKDEFGDCIRVKTEKDVQLKPLWEKDRDKYGKDYISWYEAWNPKKWGLNDYSEYSSFNSAFRNARESGEKEFVYKGERYNTKQVPKKESDMYWKSKDFVENYYKTQPYSKRDPYANAGIEDDYIKNKFGTTYLDLYKQIQTIEKNNPNDSKLYDLNQKLFAIMNEENDIYNKKNSGFQEYYDKQLKKQDAKESNERIGALNRPTYFSITSQKPQDMSEDGYWDPQKNKMFLYTKADPGKFNTTYVHEVSHKGDALWDVMETVPPINLKAFNDGPWSDRFDQEKFNYVSDPSEIEARKLSTLFYLSEHKTPWEAGKITQKTLDNLYRLANEDKLPYDIVQLLDLYGAQQDDLLKYLNGDYNYNYKPKKQKGGEPGKGFKKRLMKRNPGMQGVYGPEGENLNIVRDPNYDAGSKPYYAGDIEFMFPGLPQVSYTNKDDETLPDYVYKNPSPDKYTSVYNPRGANRADIFLDMLHGMRDDQNYEVLLQNFDKAVRDARGGDMQYYYEKDVAKGYTDSQEQWNKNYVDGQLRAQLAPGTLGMFSHGRRDYRKEKRHDSPEMRAAAKDIRNYIKGKYQDGGESKRKKYRFIKDTEEAKQFPADEWGQYIQEEPDVVVRPLTPEQQQERNMEWARREMARRNPHLYLPNGTLRPQAAQSANWVFAAPMVAPMALEALGSVAATQIPGTGVSLGTVANTAAGIHGATQVPQRIQDWQDVAAGKKDWREATAESLMTGLELYGGLSELKGFKGVPKELPGSPNSSLELGKASRTIYPQPITNSVGLKQFGQTTYSGPVSVNRTFKGDIYSIKNVRNPEGIPEEQIPYLLGREELMRRYPTDYMSKDELIGYNFKSGLKPVEYPTEIPANFTTQEDIMARILGKPLPSRAKPKVYYDLEGNPISEEEAIRILNTREYTYGGFVNRSKLNRFIK